ncbi:MAG: DeoR/GlpR transcriptional regulator [Anaerolinea sp.]|nr:DeoR/GlpR transcriptional regulator [Anaerolinea sp.]
MLLVERQQQILDLLREQGAVQIADLSAHFQVSEMTIHRDLERLAADGLLRKVRGGAVTVATAVTPTTPTTPDAAPHCLMCHKKTRRQTQMILHLADGRQQHACCPHCGLMSLLRGDLAVKMALVTGFLYGRTLTAQSATYLIDPDIAICCTPTTLAFERREDAVRFQTGFGGQLHTLQSAIAYLHEAMQLNM